MAIYEELEEKYDDSNVLPAFDRDEGIALVDLAHLVLLIDSELTDDEVEQLERRVFGLTLEEDDIPEILASGDVAAPKRVRELVDDADAREAFVAERADRIAEGDHRRAALRVLGTLSYTDGLVDEEEGVCFEIGRAFGFDSDEIEDLLIDGAVDVWELGGDEVE